MAKKVRVDPKDLTAEQFAALYAAARGAEAAGRDDDVQWQLERAGLLRFYNDDNRHRFVVTARGLRALAAARGESNTPLSELRRFYRCAGARPTLLDGLRATIADLRMPPGSPCAFDDANALAQVLAALGRGAYREAYHAYRSADTGAREYVSDELVTVLEAGRQTEHSPKTPDQVYARLRSEELDAQIADLKLRLAAARAELAAVAQSELDLAAP